MTPRDRLRRLKEKAGLTLDQLAEVFGADASTVRGWYYGRTQMRYDYLATLLRLESENLPKLSPNLSSTTLAAFYRGYRRATR